MPDSRIETAGRILGQAWLEARDADAFDPALRARTREEAYAVQDAMARVIGQRVTGWKLGATSAQMRRRAGHDGAIIGRVFESVTHPSPARLEAARYPGARAECEFAFLIHEAIEPRPEPWTAAELIGRGELHAAVEIIGNRYPKGAGAFRPTTNDEIADNGAGIGFVFGPAIPGWREQDLGNLVIDIRIDGGAPAENFLGADRCPPIDSLVQAADILGRRGIAVHPGQYVSTGAATDPRPVGPGSRVTADFGGLAAIELEFVEG